MCGRFALFALWEELAEYFQISEIEPRVFPWLRRYNVAPTQNVLGIRLEGNQRKAGVFRWGLVPGWAREVPRGKPTINARCESVQEKPSFKASFKERRCLIPASGFFEWKKEGERRAPWYIHPPNALCFAFGGIWDTWVSPEGAKIASCAILTTTANSSVAAVHARMPVMVDRHEFDLWLDPKAPSPRLSSIMKPIGNESVALHRVSPAVSDPKHEHPNNVLPFSLITKE